MGAFSANTLPAELSSAPTLCANEYEHLWRPEEGPLELQLQVFLSYLVLVLSLKLQSSARATSALHANAGLTDMYPHTQRFTWVLGI